MDSNFYFRHNINRPILENESLTSQDLKEIKILLNSRNRDKILQALNIILESLNVPENSLRLIQNDIPQFLCDVVNPSDIVTLRLIFLCLEQMAYKEEFYIHGHSSYAIESLARRIKTSMKNSLNEMIILETLSLIIKILKGCGRINAMPEKTVTEDVIQLIHELSENGVSSKYQMEIGFLIESLLSVKIVRLSENFRVMFLKSIAQCIDFKDGMDVEHLTEKIRLVCSISEKVFCFLRTTDEIIERCDLRDELISKIITFFIEVGIPYIAELFIQNNFSLKVLKHFFQVLIYIFEEPLSDKAEAAKTLANMGFLFHITNVITFAEKKEEEDLRKISLVLLTKIILTLSDKMFVFPQMWLDGRERFHKEVFTGISFLPLDASCWLEFLENPNTYLSSKLALVVYLYFYCLCSKRIEITSTIYPTIVAFLNSSLMKNNWPILFIKAVWLILAVSYISKVENSMGNESEISIEEGEMATKKMVQLLENHQNKFEFIYTHHITIPYWAFSSSNVSFDIQCKVMECWFENSEDNFKSIHELISNKVEAQLALINILENGSSQVAASAFHFLKPFIMNETDDRITTEIWMALPSILAKYTTDATKTTNVDYTVELASLKSPKNGDVSKMIRTASLLTDIIVQSDLISIYSCLKLALQLLECTIQLEDYRVAQLYLRSTDFLQKIMEKINLETSEVASFSLRIFTCLWRLPDESDMFQVPKDMPKFTLDFNLLEILDQGDFNITRAALELLEELLISEFESKIFDWDKYRDLDYYRELFFHLQTLVIKDLPNTKSLVWNCLKYCLTLKSETEEIVEYLSTSHWTHEIIRYSLHTSQDIPEMKSFLTVWIELNNKYEINSCSDLKMADSWFSESVKLIAKALTDNSLSDDKLLCKKVLESNVELELPIREELDRRCRDI